MQSAIRLQQAVSRATVTRRVTLRNTSILLLVLSVQIALRGQDWRDEDKGNEPAQPVEVPFKLFNDSLIVVRGNIGPINNVNLIVDTGTTSSVISKQVADRVKLQRHAEILETLNGPVRTESFVVPRLELGAIAGENLKVMLQDFGFLERSLGIPIAGIAGLDVLSLRNFTIDYRAKKILFTAISTRRSVPFASRNPLLIVKTTIDRQEVRLVLDTGTPTIMLFRNRVKPTVSMLADPPTNVAVTAAGRSQVQSYRLSVSIGDEALGVCPMQIVDANVDREAGFDGLLGFTAIGFRRLSFNFNTGIFGWE